MHLRDGETGAVGELEGGILFARHWRTWLICGRRLWGSDGIPGTCADRVEIGVARAFCAIAAATPTRPHFLIFVILLPWMPSAAMAPFWSKMNA
jgi:hypothetical protein